MRLKTKIPLAALAILLLGAGGAFSSLGADALVTLQCANQAGQAQVQVLHGMGGKSYLPLMDLARFYGIQVQFDSQTRKVTLSKDGMQAQLVLSQPFFMVKDPPGSYPLEPAEIVSGQLAVSPEAAEDLIGTLLNLDVRYLADQNQLVAGAVKKEEIRQEIQDQARPLPTSAPAPEAAIAQDGTAARPTEEEENDAEAQPLPAARLGGETAPEKEVYHVRRIIIDPGHGGKDSGAKGIDGQYCEKEATLDIAQRVAAILQRDPKLEIFMTRTADYFVTLKYRTEFANLHQGDLFVSIHCNANPHSKTTGTETYVYSARPSNKLAAVAAVSENGFNNDLVNLFADLHQRTFTTRSQKLAEEVDRRIRDRLNQHIRRIQHAPFYVLRQVDMPSILVETAFISNPKEERKLEDPQWRERIAQSIADGILSYRDIVENTGENQEARR